MHKAIFIFCFLVFVVGVFVIRPFSNKKNIIIPLQKDETKSLIEKKVNPNSSTYIFVPYWTLDGVVENKDKNDVYIYFGIVGGSDGISKNEPGYRRISEFSSNFPNSKRYLAVRMIDSDINSKVIQDSSIQENIIYESVEIAYRNKFSGIVLDFEMRALPLPKVIDRVSEFYRRYYTITLKKKIPFLITIYGDVFYRVRPYDMEKISQFSDGVLVMAYDFHKSGGNPGPNFPLNGQEKYGYDFSTMIKDFINVIPVDKLSIIFGMFGYNWVVNEENDSIGAGKALSLNKIRQDFLTECPFSDCNIRRDDESSETQILYDDEGDVKHIVWFEDLYSSEKKKNKAKEVGIQSFGYWAYGYY